MCYILLYTHKVQKESPGSKHIHIDLKDIHIDFAQKKGKHNVMCSPTIINHV